jgi:isocitrate dehydrogenase (NAD+)
MKMPHKVTLIPGDSVGPEVAAATQRLIEASGVSIDWEPMEAGVRAHEATGEPMPAETIASVRKNQVALKGRIATPVGSGYESPNVILRKALNLFAAVRPVRSQEGLKSRYQDVDLVVIREATEDVYAGIEHVVVPGVVQSLKITTLTATERVIRFAFDYARRRGRKKVTIVHKANIMKRSDGLFLRVGREVAEGYPEIVCDQIIADNACMQLVRDPSRFDVLVAQNLFGDLISDLAAGLVGGISGVYGVMRDAGDIHVFEAIHGIAWELDGKGIANPLPFIHAGLAMLRHLGEVDAADRIGQAIGATLKAGIATQDLGGSATTEGFVDEVIARMA